MVVFEKRRSRRTTSSSSSASSSSSHRNGRARRTPTTTNDDDDVLVLLLVLERGDEPFRERGWEQRRIRGIHPIAQETTVGRATETVERILGHETRRSRLERGQRETNRRRERNRKSVVKFSEDERRRRDAIEIEFRVLQTELRGDVRTVLRAVWWIQLLAVCVVHSWIFYGSGERER